MPWVGFWGLKEPYQDTILQAKTLVFLRSFAIRLHTSPHWGTRPSELDQAVERLSYGTLHSRRDSAMRKLYETFEKLTFSSAWWAACAVKPRPNRATKPTKVFESPPGPLARGASEHPTVHLAFGLCVVWDYIFLISRNRIRSPCKRSSGMRKL